MANELTLIPFGDVAPTQPGQTVYVSLKPLVVPWWAWALGIGVTAYALFGKEKVRTVRRYRRKKVTRRE